MKSRRRTAEDIAAAARLAHIWVRWLRARGWLLQDIATAIGVHSDAASAYTVGYRSPRPATLDRLRQRITEFHGGELSDEQWTAGPPAEPATPPAPAIERDPEAPRTRADCRGGIRPCPWIGCEHHLLVSVTERGLPVVAGRTYSTTGGPGRVDWEAVEAQVMDALENAEATGRATCAADVADLGGQTLDQVGKVLGVTRERVRQIEGVAMRKVRESALVEAAE